MQAWKIKEFWFLKKCTKIIWKVTVAPKKISSQYNYKVTYKYNKEKKKKRVFICSFKNVFLK